MIETVMLSKVTFGDGTFERIPKQVRTDDDDFHRDAKQLVRFHRCEYKPRRWVDKSKRSRVSCGLPDSRCGVIA